MRNEGLIEIIQLAQELAGSAEGMTLDEMVAFSKVSRRTVERRRDIIDETLGPLEALQDGRQVRFRLTGRGLGAFALAPTAEELAALENAARAFDVAHDPVQTADLRSLLRKTRAGLRQCERNRLAPDIEAQLRSEAFAQRVGPQPFADPTILSGLREALLAGNIVKFHYQPEGDGSARWRRVVPYGLLFGPRYYLVANIPSKPTPVLFRLDRISKLEVTDEPGSPPESFDLRAYAARSFGVFQEEPEEVTLRFDPATATEARGFVFHPSQTMQVEKDGTLTVRFTAGALLEIAHHLMTWGTSVTIQSPDRLKEIMREEVQALYEHYRPQKKGSRRG